MRRLSLTVVLTVLLVVGVLAPAASAGARAESVTLDCGTAGVHDGVLFSWGTPIRVAQANFVVLSAEWQDASGNWVYLRQHPAAPPQPLTCTFDTAKHSYRMTGFFTGPPGALSAR